VKRRGGEKEKRRGEKGRGSEKKGYTEFSREPQSYAEVKIYVSSVV
jgi:hypothetical protein